MNAFHSEAPAIVSRISRLRKWMTEQKIDLLLIPTADPHLSEYLPAHWQIRSWLSGFDGSAGTLLVTTEKAELWTDSRYWEQAERQLAGTNIVLRKALAGEWQGILEDLEQINKKPGVAGVDGRLLSWSQGKTLETRFQEMGIQPDFKADPFAEIWTDRPPLPNSEIFEHEDKWIAEDRKLKIARVRQAMREQGANYHLLTTLDDIAWLLNLRGSDIPYNPVFLAYLLISESECLLYVNGTRLNDAITQKLQMDGVTCKAYAQVNKDLAQLSSETLMLVDPQRSTYDLLMQLPETVKRIEGINPSTLFKSSKAPKEVMHVRQMMLEDGVALCEFFAWLEGPEKEGMDETQIGAVLAAYRERSPHYVCPSFETISGFNANGALPHYRPEPGQAARIRGNGLLLIDSGGQYFGGTTDITRVARIGRVSEAQKRDYTRVLKGLIALSQAHFPMDIPAPMLDSIARAPLWAAGLDYGHGTGHGVGYFLNVHEGPQSISWRRKPDAVTAMKAGMITSVEPAVYRPGKWGIRLENLVVNRESYKTAFGTYLCFETLTLCPFDRSCIDKMLLDEKEKDWLNAYHAEVRQRLQGRVSERARRWLLKQTRAI